MIYKRPDYLLQPRFAPIQQRPTSRLAGLGELGDEITGAGPTGSTQKFWDMLINNVAGKFGPDGIATVQSAPHLGALINQCAALVQLGEGGNLPQDQQAAWDSFKSVAMPNDADENIFYLFAKQLAASKTRLFKAFAEASQTGWWEDPEASRCNYTLVDTSQQGTTWYGGTTVTSKLTNYQWGSVFNKAWGILVNGLANGVLPLSYLTSMLDGMLRAPTNRRMVVFHAPPAGVDPTDPRAIAFRTAMKQLGWGSVIQEWYGYTAQAWAEDNAAFEAQDKIYSAAITTLNYLSGKAIYDSVIEKTNDYWTARNEAVQALNDFQVILNGPLGSSVPEADKTTIAVLRQQFLDADNKAKEALMPAGLWDDNQAQGLQGLGAVQFILAGTIAIAVLGILAYVVALMTETSRSAAAQTRATANSILATVDELKASCQRDYLASDKGPDAEAAYQACLLQTKALTDSIPKPPEGSDPLGLKSLALLAGVGVIGYVVLKFVQNRKSAS